MRMNHFELGDKVLRDIETYIDTFYDINFFNKDTYDVDPTQTVLGEYYIRLEVDEINHTRIVYDLYDYLESIGGVPEILR